MNQDTICAIATAQAGAVGIIRVSGPEAIAITDKLFKPALTGKRFPEQKAYTLTFGQIRDQEETVDEVLVGLFRAPHSYTGEDSTEIMCHGSAYVLQRILQLLIREGCRSARPGEYTQRAFLNGKMDLSQAEAVADLIASSSAATHRIALNQMRGGFSRELRDLRTRLLSFTSMIELELDFSEEDVEFADRKKLRNLAGEIARTIRRLTESFQVGNAIKNGIPVAIAGETNAGKSTLLNALLKEEKAIVSPIHGTTRDVIEDTINLDGIPFRFIDTAGIRTTHDEIETLGIERTYQKLQQAEIVLWVIDSTETFPSADRSSVEIPALCKDKKLLLVFNKSDLTDQAQKNKLEESARTLNAEPIFISAKEKQNIFTLEQRLVELAALPAISQNEVVVTNIRHYEALVLALDSIARVKEGLQNNLSGDLISQDLRECIFHLSDIVGEVTNDDVLGNIFKNFCVGK